MPPWQLGIETVWMLCEDEQAVEHQTQVITRDAFLAMNIETALKLDQGFGTQQEIDLAIANERPFARHEARQVGLERVPRHYLAIFEALFPENTKRYIA